MREDSLGGLGRGEADSLLGLLRVPSLPLKVLSYGFLLSPQATSKFSAHFTGLLDSLFLPLTLLPPHPSPLSLYLPPAELLSPRLPMSPGGSWSLLMSSAHLTLTQSPGPWDSFHPGDSWVCISSPSCVAILLLAN